MYSEDGCLINASYFFDKNPKPKRTRVTPVRWLNFLFFQFNEKILEQIISSCVSVTSRNSKRKAQKLIRANGSFTSTITGITPGLKTTAFLFVCSHTEMFIRSD